jgi:hypothetical protein
MHRNLKSARRGARKTNPTGDYDFGYRLEKDPSLALNPPKYVNNLVRPKPKDSAENNTQQENRQRQNRCNRRAVRASVRHIVTRDILGIELSADTLDFPPNGEVTYRPRTSPRRVVAAGDYTCWRYNPYDLTTYGPEAFYDGLLFDDIDDLDIDYPVFIDDDMW